MTHVVGLFNQLLTGGFGLFFRPFRGLGPLWGLAAISILAGILMLWIFGKVSDQEAIRTVRDRIRGNLIGIRLFGDDLGLLFRLQVRIFRQTMTYMRHALVPMLVLLVPVLLILVQLNLHFASRPLRPGEQTVVKVQLREASPIDANVELEVPDGVKVETPGVRVESLGEVAWRVRADRPGRYEVTARMGDETATKELIVGGTWGRVSTRRTGAGVVDMLLYPGEPPLERSRAFRSIEVGYAELPLSLFGLGMHWLVFFFIVSIAAGFAFRRVLGVEF